MADFETVDKRRKKKRKQRSSEVNEGDSVTTGVVSSQQNEEIDEQTNTGRRRETVDKRRKKKRKQRSSEVNEGDSVATGVVSAQHDEEIDEQRNTNKKIKQGGPWNNLDLILSLQNKELDVQRKVELAIEFVNSRKLKRDDDSDGGSETVSVSRLIAFLSDWIQSLLISPVKKIRVEWKKPRVIEACLDVRCWVIFKFCLEESLCLRVPLNVSPNLLRALSCIGRDALSVMEKEKSFIHGEGSELYSLLLDSVSLLFSSHGGVFNGNADQWVTLVATLIDLVHKLYLDKVSGHSVGNLILRLSYLIMERFSNFLRVHPSPKNIFTVFLDRLLEPLLSLLAVLYIQTDSSDSRWAVNLLKTVEDILSNGLFHPVHVVGFLNLSTHSTEKYMRLDDGKAKKLNKDIKSYHRHFFQKLEKIMSKKTVSAFSGMGELFRLFVIRVKKQKGVHVLSEVTKITGETGVSRDMEKTNDGLMSKMSTGNGKAAPGNAYSSNRIDTVTSKAFFDLFVRFMKPLALDIKGYSETNLEVGSMLFDALCTFKSANKILAGFMREKVYERTEDTSEGACLNFLKEFYQIIISFSAKIQLFWLSTLKVDNGRPMEMLPLVAKEVIVSLGYFLEIEYEVVGNDLVSLWHTMLSYLAIDLFVRGTAERCLLTSEILHLGCQLINIYSDLRQVNNPIFALCKAVRLFGFAAKNGTEHSTSVSCTSSLSSETCVKSVIMLLCLQEFRLAICNAIKSIPEGQASGCIRQLTVDISESLDWIKVSCSKDQEKDIGPSLQNCGMPHLYLQAELLGKALSEVYTIILDDLAVTTGNSILVGNSIKSLMKTVGPSLSTLVGKQPDSINEFLFSAIGRRLSLHEIRECSNGLPIVRSSASWVFLFFFRVYISLRSLYRQSICLMPPDSSRKASAAMGDLFTANSGQDCKGSTDWRDEGYFSWVVKPSDSLMAILQSVSEICHQETVTGCAPLVYVMHVMAFQRLVDLNRQINAFEFLQEGAVRLVEMNSMDEACLPMYRKESKKLKKTLSILRQEAVDVTSFLMGYLQLIVKKVESISSDDCATSAGEESQIAHEDDAWDLSVSSLNEMSLPIAVWQILCQNTDIWCPHATKKELKKFLFLLFHIFLSCAKGSCEDVGKHNMGKPDNLRKVTLHQISLELLGDTVFYEQTFLRRHLTSRFCDALEKSVLSLFGDSMSKDVDLSSLPDWSEVLSELEKTSVILQNKRHVADGAFSALRPDSVPSDSPSVKYSKEFTACLSLLDLLRWMPKGYPKSKSFSVYATYILNLERLVVFRLLDHGKVHVHNHYELFKLFVCCRKTLKHLVMASCEVNSEVGQFSVLPIFSENSYSVLWLLKSVSALVQHLPAFPEEHATQVKYMVFSLMDHTSYVFLTFTKDQFGLAVNTLKHYEQPSAELPISGELTGKDNLNESDPKFEFSKHFEALKSVEHMAESLKEHTKSLFTSLKMVLPNEKLKVGFNVVDLNKMSTTISCFQGFLWGIASVLKDRFEQCTEETKSLRGGFARSSKLNLCITMFEDFINFCIHALLVEDFREPDHLDNDQSLRERDNINDPLSLEGSNGSQLKFSEDVIEVSTQHQEGKISGKMDDLLSDPDDNHEIPQSSQNTFVENSSVRRKRFKSKYADCAINILNEVDSFDKQCLKKSLLRSLLKGEHPEVAFSIRQLFIASSAILTLKMQIYSSTFLSSSMPISIGTSHFLLSELADMVEEPHSFSFVWLDGILKYLEVLGSYISLTNPTSSRNVYARLINLHLRAIGKCISLQGKGATLASHETESSTKTLMRQIRSSKSSIGHGQYSLHEFKARLRMSFKVFIKKPLELHLLTSVQALERALIGVHEEWNTIYEINTGGPHGGKVSSNVAAGVDCFDLVLESVSGRSRLSMVKKHIRSLIAALFNIVLHLQDPLIFYERISWTNGGCDPDSGSVILMCVEVLTKVAAKPALFEMDPCHVGQSLRIPAALFRDFHLLSSSKSLSSTLLLSASQGRNAVADTHPYIVDQQFSVDLFAACCRLLSTVLRHYGSESERCISVVEESVSILLHCLEMVDTGLVGREGYYAWEVMQGTKCASFLRRIYEEIRQQKEVLGRYSSHFLSTYIWVYSGYGPFKAGIRREIDEALRPGVYALLDACSTDDLQQLHTVLGEGPCRSTLANLQHDYKHNFQYEGKV